MFAMPALLKKWKWFQKFWPYSFTEEELEGDGTGKGLMEAEVWSIKEIAIFLRFPFPLWVLPQSSPVM